MATIDGEGPLAHVASVARTIHRFSSYGAVAGLAVGVVTFLALWPWLAGLEQASLVVALVLAVVLVVAPLRVLWHGRKIVMAYGDPDGLERALAAVPGALEEAAVAWRGVVRPEGRGFRRLLASWRSLVALNAVWQGPAHRERLDVLVDPVRAEALNLSMAALWATLATLVLGPPVALVSLAVLALT